MRRALFWRHGSKARRPPLPVHLMLAELSRKALYVTNRLKAVPLVAPRRSATVHVAAPVRHRPLPAALAVAFPDGIASQQVDAPCIPLGDFGPPHVTKLL
jgi:hypothetical protein